MSNLIVSNNLNNSVSVREKRTELSLMLKKVVIKLSRDEFEVIEQLIFFWINIKHCESLEEKALYVLVFVNIYRKMMPHTLKLTSRITLSLTMPEAFALNWMLGDLELGDFPYEQMLTLKITGEINRQTN